ncbi:CHAT domain-containing protein [Actinoplanes oblitus]|uniref:CHAT domain-containing protein n=1 Tax=Actinoplanes oblitus TaxID=3040509 RepID=A0ABY8W5Z6_9ACTN|nr:CHAT domain-containing protein [Actinoplanes oblitus]WIM93244.1 CHAT domain-containing protein [Actinoplanes oblitus]
MELEVPRVWLRLSFELQVDGQFAVGVTDHRGRRVTPPRPGRGAYGWDDVSIPATELTPPLVLRRPTAVWRIFRDAVGALPDFRTGSSSPPALPIFVSVPRELALIRSDVLVSQVLPPSNEPPRWVAVHDRPAFGQVAPFVLPLTIVGVGERGADALRRVEQTPWSSPDESLQAHLADITWLDEPADVIRRQPEGDVDVLVLDAYDARALTAAGSSAGIRAAIVLGAGPAAAHTDPESVLPLARSVITVAGPPDAVQLDIIALLLRGVSRDLPLHEAVREAATHHDAQGRVIALSASPDALHDLRLTAAWDSVEGSVVALSGTIGAGTGSTTVASMFPPEQHELGRSLIADVDAARHLEFSFTGEAHGLIPLAIARKAVADAERAARELASAFAPGTDPTVTRDGVRVVNLGLRRRGDQVGPPGVRTSYVEHVCSLAAGQRYDLEVQIGAAWPQSLVVGELPSVDMLLPDDRRGHDLHVAVFTDTMTVVGEATRVLRLPPSGPSPVLTFPLVAGAAGPAWARVSLYHRDNLLQTFRLDLLVEEAERTHPGMVASAGLQHSATRDWGNLGALGRRALSLTVNSDGARGHRLFVKGEDLAVTLPIDHDRGEEVAREVRQILTANVNRAISSAEALWRLAVRGSDLFTFLFDRLREEADALAAVCRREDETLQIIRADPAESVPWSLVYDWDLPDFRYGDESPPVCFGRTEEGRRCTHHSTDGVVCVYGFWGIRHHVEELLAAPRETDLPGTLRITEPSVLVALGVDPAATGDLVGRLSAVFPPPRVRHLGSTDRLLDSLFSADRPAVVIVLGHHKTTDVVSEPVGSRIALRTADGWLQAKEITRRRRQNGSWQPPQSIVMLLSCGSAAPAPTAMSSFLAALNGVGAGAVLGTECDVYSDLAADFAINVLAALAGAEPIGRALPFAGAVRAARHRIVIDKGDARGLAFAAFGPAELALVRQ